MKYTKNRTTSEYFSFSRTVLILITMISASCAGAGAAGDDPGVIILYPIIAAVSLICTYVGIVIYGRKKEKEVEALIPEIASEDPVWNLEKLKKNVTRIFYEINTAYLREDKEYAREYMTDNMYEHFTVYSQRHTGQSRDFELDSIKIISVDDYADNSRDAFTALIQSSKIRYSGTKSKKRKRLPQLWSFLRSGDKWLIDHIDTDVSLKSVCGV